MFIVQLFFTVVTCLLFLFAFWKKLKEDYTQNQIFTTGFYILLGLGVGNTIAVNYLPLWWFWLAFAGSLAGLLIGKLRFAFRIFEVVDAYVAGGLFILAGLFFSGWYFGKNNTYLLGLLVSCLFLLVYKYLESHYKRFSWYKSGRVGFSGLMTAGIFFLVRSVIALVSPDMLSFVGSTDVFMSGILAFVLFFALFNLSRKEI